jgi:hypothetical protein
MALESIVETKEYPLSDPEFRAKCKETLDKEGALVFKGFLQKSAIEAIRKTGAENKDKAYFCEQKHNVYLTPSDPNFAEDHIRNKEVLSTKGCITDDQIPEGSELRDLYNSEEFKSFLSEVLGEDAMHPYADPLSSINLHYAGAGQELGWHFDNSSFAITLMIQAPEDGGSFDFVKDLRDADNGEMNFSGVEDVLNDKTPLESLAMPAGTLVMFRGRNSIHRVAPVKGDTTRMLVVLAYNSKPGISLDENARRTFYGRLN